MGTTPPGGQIAASATPPVPAATSATELKLNRNSTLPSATLLLQQRYGSEERLKCALTIMTTGLST